MSAPKRQHYVPQCYLREFVDSSTPVGQEPYVWIFSKDGKTRERRAPKNIFHQTDLYTLDIKGQKHFEIEKSLSVIEREYAAIVRNKIKKHLPLSEYEHVILSAFVVVMMQRTIRHKDNLESFYDQIIAQAQSMERHHGVPPKKSQELREEKKDVHKKTLVGVLPELLQMVFNMTVAFLCTDGTGARFITSDDPVTLFNPDLQWQRFYGPGLGQRNIQVTMPISPDIPACLSWSKLRGYIRMPRSHVEDLNRMTRGHCYRHFIANSSKKKFIWFSKYPLRNPFFTVKIIFNRMKFAIGGIIFRYRYGRFRKN